MKAIVLAGLLTALSVGTSSNTPEQLNDLEMAHVAVTASNIDIEYAHLALAFSENEEIRAFAKTMIRDHSAVNDQVFALARRLGVTAMDNDLSRELRETSREIKDELSQLRGIAFDKRYAENEAAYHQAVNGIVAEEFIPNIENTEVKAAFQAALQVFLVHQEHAEAMNRELNGS